MLDEAIKNYSFDHYARILVKIDLSQSLFDEIRVERENFTFYMEIVYEKLLEYCVHCKAINHVINSHYYK